MIKQQNAALCRVNKIPIIFPVLVFSDWRRLLNFCKSQASNTVPHHQPHKLMLKSFTHQKNPTVFNKVSFNIYLTNMHAYSHTRGHIYYLRVRCNHSVVSCSLRPFALHFVDSTDETNTPRYSLKNQNGRQIIFFFFSFGRSLRWVLLNRRKFDVIVLLAFWSRSYWFDPAFLLKLVSFIYLIC